MGIDPTAYNQPQTQDNHTQIERISFANANNGNAYGDFVDLTHSGQAWESATTSWTSTAPERGAAYYSNPSVHFGRIVPQARMVLDNSKPSTSENPVSDRVSFANATPAPSYNPYDDPTTWPLFNNPLHKGKGSSSAGNSGDDKQNNNDDPPVLGYYYGDDDELYFYSNSPYFDPVDNNDDNTDLLGFYPIINDEQPNAYPISYPVVSNPNYGNNQADEHYWWSYFVPGYGDYLSFKEAETGWDYTLATAGIVWKPARGAKIISRGSKAKKAAEKAENVAGAAGKLLPNGQSLSEFEKSLSRLPAGERVAEVKTVSKQVAQQNGWQKNNQLTTKNGGRDIYTDSKGNHYALDTQHGNWEMLNKQGKHQGVMNFDGSIKPNSKDLSGGHDIRIK